MSTLNRSKSEELFYRLMGLKGKILYLAGSIQNPDFVNEENAQEIYQDYYNINKDLKRELADIHDEVLELFRPLIKEDM